MFILTLTKKNTKIMLNSYMKKIFYYDFMFNKCLTNSALKLNIMCSFVGNWTRARSLELRYGYRYMSFFYVMQLQLAQIHNKFWWLTFCYDECKKHHEVEIWNSENYFHAFPSNSLALRPLLRVLHIFKFKATQKQRKGHYKKKEFHCPKQKLLRSHNL